MAEEATTAAPRPSMKKLFALFPKHEDGRPKYITQPSEFNEVMGEILDSGLCNLLCSIIYVDYIPPVQAVSLRVIPSREQMWYRPSFGKGSLALTGEALATLFREAGGSYRSSERMDDASDSLYCHMKATVAMRAMNGLDAIFSKDRELDLRPGSPESTPMTDKQLPQAKMTILRVCETKAQLRAIRTALGAKQLYTAKEASMPFVIPVLVPNPDMSNPVHANFMLAHSMGAVDALYGKKALPPANAGTVETPHGTVDTTTGELYPDDDLDGAVAANEAAGALDDFEEADVARCTCPCGCTDAVADAAAEMTQKRRGVVRCALCYPGRAFDEAKHKNLTSLAMNPDVTVKQAIGMKAEAVKK